MADLVAISSNDPAGADLGPTEIGGKAHGLWSLPAAWTPPFLVLGLPFFDRWVQVGAQRALERLDAADLALVERLLGDAAGHATGEIVVRSNAPDETLPERGRYHSVSAEASLPALAAALDEVLARDAGQQMCPILQERVRAFGWGHLSNERRVSRRRDVWLIEERTTSRGETSHVAVAARAGPSEALHASTHTELHDRLRQVAGLLTARQGQTHCEWVWDGRRVWIVQADEVMAGAGEADAYLRRHDSTSRETPSLQLLRRLEPGEARSWSKLTRTAVLRELGMPAAEVCFLEGSAASRILERDRARFEHDFAALAAAADTPLVIRCDVRQGAHDSLSLPTSDPLTRPEQALAFVAQVAEEFAQLGVASEDWAVLPAALVPARASVMVQAKPRAQTIRLDALWGFPDGLRTLSHDTLVHRTDDDRSRERTRYKGSCLLYDRERGWHFATVGAPFDWGHVLDRTEIAIAASWARRLADHLQREVQLMVLARIGGARGPAGMLAWHYTDHVVPPLSRPVAWEPVRNAPLVRTPAELVRAHETAPLAGIRFAPTVQQVRSARFIRNVGQVGAELNVPIYFSGSVLGHTYYMLRREGAHVVFVGADAPELEPDQYDKLVRDLIPQMVRQSGTATRVVRAPAEQAVGLLKHKLIEEALEVWSAEPELVGDELADLLEVVDALLVRLELSRADVEAIQSRKREARGGFDQLVYLEATAPLSEHDDDVGLFGAPDETIAPVLRRRVGPVTVERHGEAIELRLPAAPPLRRGVPLNEYGVEVGGARLRFRHDGLTLLIHAEPMNESGAPGQLSLPIEMP